MKNNKKEKGKEKEKEKDITQNIGEQFSDVDIMKDCLATQSFMTYKYNLFTSQTVSIPIRDMFLTILDEEHNMQNEIFSEIKSRNWSTPGPTPQKDEVDQVKKSFEQQKL